MRQVVAARRQFRNGSVELTFKTLTLKAGSDEMEESGGIWHEVTNTIWFDETRWRSDQNHGHVPVLGLPNPSNEPYRTRTVLTPEIYIHESLATRDRLSEVAETGPRAQAQGLERNRFAVRELGLVPIPFGLLYLHTFDSLLTPAATDLSVESRPPEGDLPATLVLHWTATNANKFSLRIDPNKGHAVVESLLTQEYKGRTVRYSVKSELGECGPGQWFPTRVSFVKTRDSKIVDREEWVVESARFNIEIDDDVFSLKGLKLPKGKVVVTSPHAAANKEKEPASRRQVKKWDGEKLIDLRK